MKRWMVTLGVVCCACGDNDHPARLLMAVSADPPAYGTAPFPTDAVREGLHLGVIAGLDKIAKQHSDLVADHLASLDGWGLRPAIEFPVEGLIDADSIPARTGTMTDALLVLDVDPATAEDLAPIQMDWKYEPLRHSIVGSPHVGTMLHEGTRYAAVVTTDIKSGNGDPLFGAKALAALLHDPPARWKTTGEAYDKLRQVPQLADRIAGITVFTTQHASDGLVKARNVLANPAQVPAPTLAFDEPAVIFDTQSKLDALLGHAARFTSGTRSGQEHWGNDNPTGLAHDHIAVVATGKMQIARFRRDDTGTDGSEDETFELGAGGVPIVRSIDVIPVTVILPKGAVPATGFPVIVFGHGLGGSRHDALDIAEPLAAQGYAIVAIDMWGHGSRYDPIDTGNNLGGKPDFTGNRYLPDGFGDNVGTTAYFDFFEGFMNLGAIRDSIRQSALDFSMLATLVQTAPDLDALVAPYTTTPKLDPTKVAYLGQSFGTIVGVDLAAIEPSIGLYVLDVPGGGVVDQIVPASPYIADLALPFATQIYRTEGTFDRFHPLVAYLQAILDGGDSLTFAHHVLVDRFRVANEYLGKRHVVCIEVLNDELMPNAATEALARAFKLSVLRPDLNPPAGLPEAVSPAMGNNNNQTAMLVQYEPATHGFNWSAEQGKMEYRPGGPQPGDQPFTKLPQPIVINEPIYETHAQVAEILSTYFSGATPRVRSTKAPQQDFDGDGKLDTEDPDPLDPNK